jgi:hypothetical protein
MLGNVLRSVLGAGWHLLPCSAVRMLSCRNDDKGTSMVLIQAGSLCMWILEDNRKDFEPPRYDVC